MKSGFFIFVLGVFMLALLGCSRSPKSGAGFTLPDGDAEQGKSTYVRLQCNACHTISGVEQLRIEAEEVGMSIALGGEVARIKTYGELVTSVINPSHKLAKGYQVDAISDAGESKMTNYNDVMSVTDLINLVAFLQSKYELRKLEPTDYPSYGPYYH